MTAVLKLKRGNTLSLSNKVTDKSGPVPITGWEIKSQIRDGRTLVATLTTTITNAPIGEFTLDFEGDTSLWPIKKLSCDIQYRTATGQVVSTETFIIDVELGVTE